MQILPFLVLVFFFFFRLLLFIVFFVCLRPECSFCSQAFFKRHYGHIEFLTSSFPQSCHQVLTSIAFDYISHFFVFRLTQFITRTRLRIGAASIWVTLLSCGMGFVLGSDLHTNEGMGSEWCIIKMIGLSTVQSGLPICIVFVMVPIFSLAILYGATSWTLLRSVAKFKSAATAGRGDAGRYQGGKFYDDCEESHLQKVVYKTSDRNTRSASVKLSLWVHKLVIQPTGVFHAEKTFHFKRAKLDPKLIKTS